MVSSSSLCKNKEVLARNGGENGTNIIVMSAVCRSWTWHLSAFVSGWGHLISFFTYLRGFGWSLLTSHSLFASSSWPLIYWFQIMPNSLSCRLYVQDKLTSASTNLPLILIWSWFTRNYIPLSRVDDVGNIMAHLRSSSLPVHFSSLSRKLI